MRSYTTTVDQDRMERVDGDLWKRLLFVMCFLHSVASPVAHAWRQPNRQLHLRWAMALICVALSTVGRAVANLCLVLWCFGYFPRLEEEVHVSDM